MRNSSVIGRAAATAAVLVAVAAVAVILLSGGSSYQVKAVFTNASQIVNGDLVEVSGNSIGAVSNITLTPTGQAELTLTINNKSYEPLRQGTQATIREASLSGIANRYVDLRLGPGTAAKINDGGTIPTQDTTSAVDLDELFNTLDAPTRKGLQEVIQGSASQYAGQGKAIQAAWQYLNPAVVSTSVLFREINRDTNRFTNLLVKSSNLVTDVSQRSSDLTGLIQHLSSTTGALANQRTALGRSIQRLPPFMRLANTTFVNLRRALDDIQPLVDATRPVAPKLQKLLAALKPLAEQSVPTVRDLANIVSRPGANNDLIELIKLGVPLAGATVRNIRADGELRRGAFPESTLALHNSTPELSTARPYAVDLTGWFEGYSHPGGYDANGGYSRVAPIVGVASVQNGVLNFLPSLGIPLLRPILAFGGPGNKTSAGGLLTTGQGDRCPGSMAQLASFQGGLAEVVLNLTPILTDLKLCPKQAAADSRDYRLYKQGKSPSRSARGAAGSSALNVPFLPQLPIG
jgi:phospholipid/cholesterol/gamma-HCH transport system substrate-binding protein